MTIAKATRREAVVLILPATGMASDEERELIDRVGTRYTLTRIESGADGDYPRLIIPGRSQYYEGMTSIRALVG